MQGYTRPAGLSTCYVTGYITDLTDTYAHYTLYENTVTAAEMTTHRAERNSNTVKVLDVLRKNPRCTINEIADLAHLSRLTVAKILDRLAADKIVKADGKAPGRLEGGPKPQLFHFNGAARHSVGILIGERSVAGRLVDLNIKTVARCRRVISLEAGIPELLAIVEDVFTSLIKRKGVSRRSILGIGVGSQGVTDSEHGVVLTSPHNPGWGTHLPLRDLIQERVGTSVPVYIDNAIRFRTLAETTAGILRNVKNAHVIHCAEGLIAGNILNAAIYRGAHNYAGSIGHMKVNVRDTERCDCGGYGCFEMQVMPRRILARAQELKPRYADSSLFGGKKTPTLGAVFAGCEAGDLLSLALIDEAVGWFAIAIHNIILMFDPEVVVIQGTYAKAGEYFIRSLRDRIGTVSLLNVTHGTRIECSQLDDEEAGTLGAASYPLLHAF